MTMPFMLGFTVTVVSFIDSLRKPKFERESYNWKEFLQFQGIGWLLLTVGTLHTLLVVAAVSPFKCVQSDNFYVLFDVPSVRCFDAAWFAWLPLVVFFLLIYTFILPGLLLFLFLKHRRNQGDSTFSKLFGNFVNPFKEQYFWWRLVFVFKRTTFSIVAAMLKMKDLEVFSSFIAIMILFFFLWAETRCSPFKDLSRLHLSTA
jgi:hypothetical protein